MRKTKVWHIILGCIIGVIACFGITSCSSNSKSIEQDIRQPSEPLDSHDYFPLSIGNRWRYRVTERDYVGEYEYRIDRQLSRNGQLCFELRAEREGTNPAPMLYAVQEKGVVSYSGIFGSEALNFDKPFIDLPTPLTTKAEWHWKGEISLRGGAVKMPRTFKSYFLGLENCTVPAGRFEDCIKIKRIVKSIGPRDTNIYWFAKDLGLVKMVLGSRTYELISYN